MIWQALSITSSKSGKSQSLSPVLKSYPLVTLKNLLEQSREALTHQLDNQPAPLTVFFSFTEGTDRAETIHFSGETSDSIWEQCYSWIANKQQQSKKCRWLRVDLVHKKGATNWNSTRGLLASAKRNYFRYGIALDNEMKHAFLEQELNANAMLYPSNDKAQATLNENNFTIYARKRFGKNFTPDFRPDQPVIVFTTLAWLFQSGTPPIELNTYTGGKEGRDTGRRPVESLDAEQTHQIIDHSSQFLARQVNNQGRFVYGLHPCFDREINTYNTLRHASTTYSMLEAWEVTRNQPLKAAIDRSLNYLTQQLINTYDTDSGPVAYLTDLGDEIKLGGNAVSILALVKYTELTQDKRYIPLTEQLAAGIERLQNPETGQLCHVINSQDLSVKEAFRIIYYDGEAAFGLMRLYGLTKNERWLNIVEKAFDYFIAQEHWKIHDHWLSYCVNELTLYRPEERYYQFGIQNVAGYLDFVAERITTFPTLLELMMAAHKMITRLESQPEHRHLLEQLDKDKFYLALEKRAHYLLNGHFWPEFAMFYKNPQRILGSFFIRHHAFRVRIDDVEHYLSGFVAYLHYYLNTPDTDNSHSDNTQVQVAPL
jgi:hypothetical protein